MKINIPTNAKYFKASYRQYNDGVLQIEYGQTATDYQSYTSQSFNYTLSNPLYRLSDSVYDYIDLNKGKIVRNVGVIEFDGSGYDFDGAYITDHTKTCRFVNSGINKLTNTTIIKCNKFINNEQNSDEERIRIVDVNGKKYLYLYVNVDRLDMSLNIQTRIITFFTTKPNHCLLSTFNTNRRRYTTRTFNSVTIVKNLLSSNKYYV